MTRPQGVKTRPGELDHAAARLLRQRRILAGLTQQAVADKLGITYQQQHKRETGLNRLTVEAFVKAFQAVGMCPAEAMSQIIGEKQSVTLQPQARRALIQLVEEIINAK